MEAETKWICDNCRKQLSNPIKCSKFMNTPYCNKECQKESLE